MLCLSLLYSKVTQLYMYTHSSSFTIYLFDYAGSSLLHGLLSRFGEQGLPSNFGARLLIAVISCCQECGLWGHRLRQLRHMGSVVAALGF